MKVGILIWLILVAGIAAHHTNLNFYLPGDLSIWNWVFRIIGILLFLGFFVTDQITEIKDGFQRRSRKLNNILI